MSWESAERGQNVYKTFQLSAWDAEGLMRKVAQFERAVRVRRGKVLFAQSSAAGERGPLRVTLHYRVPLFAVGSQAPDARGACRYPLVAVQRTVATPA